MVPRGGGMLRGPEAPATLPAWLSEHDLDFYAGEFKRKRLPRRPYYYRNLDRNWELMAPFADMRVTVPALYVAGDRDMVIAGPGMDQHLANLKHFVPALRDILMLPGCGHWTQQSAPRGQRRDHRFRPQPAELRMAVARRWRSRLQPRL